MDKKELLKLVEHIEIPIEIIMQSEMLKNEYLHPFILRISDVKPGFALSLIKDFGLKKNFNVKEIVGKLINVNKFREFEFWIKEFDLKEDKEWLKKQIKRIILKKDFDTALSLIKNYGLKDEFNVKKLVERISEDFLDEDDVYNIFYYIENFDLYKDKEWFQNFVIKMFNKGEIDDIFYYIKRFDLGKYLDLKELVEMIIDEKKFDDAYEWINEFGLGKDKEWLKTQITKIIKNKGFNKVYDLVEKFGLGKDKEWLKEQLNIAIPYIFYEKNKENKKEYVYYVFLWISDFGLEDEFDVKELIEKLIINEGLIESFGWIRKFGLDKDIDWLKEQVQKMINKNKYNVAYYLIKKFDLYKDKEWFKEQIQKMVNEKEFEWALSFINFLDLKKEFDIEVKELIGGLINQEKFDEAYNYIKVFDLDEDKEWLKEQIQKIINQKRFYQAYIWIERFELEEEKDWLKEIVLEIYNKDRISDVGELINLFHLEKEFDIEKIREIVEELVDAGEFYNSYNIVLKTDLKEDKNWLKEQIQKMVNEKEFYWALDWIKDFGLEEEYKEEDIKKMIEGLVMKKEFEDAFDNIKKFGFEGYRIWLKELVRKIYDMGEIEEARKWIRNFYLEEELKDLL